MTTLNGCACGYLINLCIAHENVNTYAPFGTQHSTSPWQVPGLGALPRDLALRRPSSKSQAYEYSCLLLPNLLQKKENSVEIQQRLHRPNKLWKNNVMECHSHYGSSRDHR